MIHPDKLGVYLEYDQSEVVGMCGRYTFFTDKELKEIDDIIEQISDDIQREKMKTGEIFPTDVAPVIVPKQEIITPKLMKWGFPNFYGKGVVINARAETARAKRMFGASLETRRCIVPSTGFYEWDATKQKFLFNVPGSGMVYMAGLFNRFDGEDRFVILTTQAGRSMEGVHDRMPVVIPKDQVEEWILDAGKTDDILSGHHPDLLKNLVA